MTVVNDASLRADCYLRYVQGTCIALGESQDDDGPCFTRSFADTIHLWRMQRERIGLVGLQDGLSRDEVVCPGSPRISCTAKRLVRACRKDQVFEGKRLTRDEYLGKPDDFGAF